MTNKIEYSTCRKKLTIGLLISILFIYLGIIISQNSYNGSLISPIEIIAFIDIAFFSVLFTIILTKLTYRHPVLIISDRGINYRPGQDGYIIPWSDISEIKEIKINSSFKAFAIVLTVPKIYINKESNIFRKWLYKFNLTTYKTPIILSSSCINANHKSLKHALEQAYIDNN